MKANNSDNNIFDWLIKNGGPAIKYKTAVELIKNLEDKEISKLRKNLITSNIIFMFI